MSPHDDGNLPPDFDAAHRTRVNLLGGLFIILLIGFAVFVVKLLHDQEQLQRCLDSRRTNCFPVDQNPREGIRLPTR